MRFVQSKAPAFLCTEDRYQNESNSDAQTVKRNKVFTEHLRLQWKLATIRVSRMLDTAASSPIFPSEITTSTNFLPPRFRQTLEFISLKINFVNWWLRIACQHTFHQCASLLGTTNLPWKRNIIYQMQIGNNKKFNFMISLFVPD